MGDPVATSDDLAAYLGDSTIDDDRATLLLALAQEKCEAILSPLPPTARGVVLDIAARAFSNPLNVQSQAAGPTSVGYGPVAGGLWLTRANRAELLRLKATSGAFSVDPTPADASPRNAWAQVALSPVDLYNSPPLFGDWDIPTSGG